MGMKKFYWIGRMDLGVSVSRSDGCLNYSSLLLGRRIRRHDLDKPQTPKNPGIPDKASAEMWVTYIHY